MSDDPLESEALDEIDDPLFATDDPLERGLIYLRDEIEGFQRGGDKLEACLNGDPPDSFTISDRVYEMSDRVAAEWVLREIARRMRFAAEMLEEWADDADTGFEDLPRLEG